jgi:hypothetical protein
MTVRCMKWAVPTAVGLTITVVAGPISYGATLLEHFNNYGTERVAVQGLGTEGDGWGGAWGGNTRPDYLPGYQLTYNDPNYNNAPNLSGPNHGVATYELDAAGSMSGQFVRRNLAEPMTGTIWISALGETNGPSGSGLLPPDVIFWLNANVNNQNYFGLRSETTSAAGQPLEWQLRSSIRYANTTPAYRGAFANGETHLMLVRLDLDVNELGHDNLQFWVNPNLSGGAGGLGAPVWDMSGSNMFESLTSVGISFTGVGSYMDAIRISNDPNGFEMVTMVPEPGALSLLGLGALAMLRRRSTL